VDNLHEQAGSKKVVHMHGELFKSRCDRCNRPPFDDTNLYDSTAEIPRVRMRRSDSPAHLLLRPGAVRVGSYEAWDACTVFIAVRTSGVVEPAASLVAQVTGRARTIYVGPEEPANAPSFTECYLGKAGEVLPDLLGAL
jgi:NAD-dependent deacetylase